jgi:hypothetical protein
MLCVKDSLEEKILKRIEEVLCTNRKEVISFSLYYESMFDIYGELFLQNFPQESVRFEYFVKTENYEQVFEDVVLSNEHENFCEYLTKKLIEILFSYHLCFSDQTETKFYNLPVRRVW